jgi:hypothetical protein
MRLFSGLQLGAAALALVGAVFVGVFAFGPERAQLPLDKALPVAEAGSYFPDAASKRAIAALEAANPKVAETLGRELAFAARDGRDQQGLADILLQALFVQFGEQAVYVQRAEVEDFDLILSGMMTGVRQLEAANSPWCQGPEVAAFLSTNDDEIVPALLDKFPYGSAQYVWAMNWMTRILQVAEKAQNFPTRHGRPTSRDEYILQEEGRALGSSQWALVLQIANFANAEGQSYQAMQEAISAIDVCELGFAIETVSERLPPQVRGRIWADLMPEIMVGNTPYALARVQDYFFIG